jgi:hypothetical protein
VSANATVEFSEELVETLAERVSEILGRGRFLTLEGLAEHFGVKERTVKTWRAAGMPAYGTRPLMFDVEEAERWLAKRPAS